MSERRAKKVAYVAVAKACECARANVSRAFAERMMCERDALRTWIDAALGGWLGDEP